MQLNSVEDIISELDRSEVTLLSELADAIDLRPVEAVMVEGSETCELEPGTRLVFPHPAATPKRPKVCPALLRALRPYVTAAALGIPSEDPEGYLVHCPGRKTSIWRVSAI